ncbi:MAG: endonuclease III [Armatimonadetes bacterium]|nr:endonuclease III [Armatimonadota bacterium]
MSEESLKSKQKRAAQVVAILKKIYPDATHLLDNDNPFEQVVFTILAAQCTDARVETVAPELFRRWPTVEAMASAPAEEVEDIIRPLGFFRQKTRSLIEMSRDVCLKFGGKVPATMEELTQLRGVGRKTANVVLAHCFGGGSVIVDTHCRRVSRRLDFTRQQDPTKIEFELQKVVEPEDWSVYGTLLVWHGRAICTARNPQCAICPILHLCPEGQRRMREASHQPQKATAQS